MSRAAQTAQTSWKNHDDPTAEAEVDVASSSEKEPDRATMLQALRDLEGAKARVERDAQRVSDQMREELVLKLLPVLDNLDRTIEAAETNRDAPAVVEGVQLVRAQLEAVLRGYGALRIDVAPEMRFDPKVHEAVSMLPVTDPAAHGLVIAQTEPGYRFRDKLLRPAKVVVARFQGPAQQRRWQ